MAEGDRLPHIDATGAAHMVDVAAKDDTARTATAIGSVTMKPETLEMILTGNAKKGDVIATTRIAGIMAAKRTHELVPLCHPLVLTKVTVDIEPDESLPGLGVQAAAKITGKTGVEMEALTAASVTCLTIYDMAKAVDRFMVLSGIQVVAKSGGQSGDWKAPGWRGEPPRQEPPERRRMMSLIPVDEALARLLGDAVPTHAENVPLADASGRTLAVDLAATRTPSPPFPPPQWTAMRCAPRISAPFPAR